MESFPISPQENLTLHQENILLEGPDGFRFTVQKTGNVNSNELAQPRIDLPSMTEFPASESEPNTETQESNEGSLSIPEGPIKIGVLATAGLGLALAVRRHLNNPSRFVNNPNLPAGTTESRSQQSANRRARDTENHRAGARGELDRHQTKKKRDNDKLLGIDDQYPKLNDVDFFPDIDLVARFKSSHTRRRLANAINHDSFTPVEATQSRTKRQEISSLRANLRGDASRKRISKIDQIVELYGPAVAGSRKDLDDYIDRNNFSRKHIKSLRKASKSVHKLQSSDQRIQGRLARQANANDIPGRTSKANHRLHRD